MECVSLIAEGSDSEQRQLAFALATGLVVLTDRFANRDRDAGGSGQVA